MPDFNFIYARRTRLHIKNLQDVFQSLITKYIHSQAAIDAAPQVLLGKCKFEFSSLKYVNLKTTYACAAIMNFTKINAMHWHCNSHRHSVTKCKRNSTIK